MERQKGALLDLDRIKNERLLRFQKLQSLQVRDQNSCKQIRKVKAGICKIQKAHKLEENKLIVDRLDLQVELFRAETNVTIKPMIH